MLSRPLLRNGRSADCERRRLTLPLSLQISTLVDLFQAARISTHSVRSAACSATKSQPLTRPLSQAIIGADAPPATFLDILSPAEGTLIPAYGNTRRRVLLALHNRLSAALDDMSTPLEDWDDEADRLSFIYFIHWKCYSAELPQWHHESTRDVVAAAVRLLDRAPPSWKGRQRVLRTIQQCLVSFLNLLESFVQLTFPLRRRCTTCKQLATAFRPSCASAVPSSLVRLLKLTRNSSQTPQRLYPLHTSTTRRSQDSQRPLSQRISLGRRLLRLSRPPLHDHFPHSSHTTSTTPTHRDPQLLHESLPSSRILRSSSDSTTRFE